MVVFDATILLFIFSEHVGVPIDPATGKPLDRPKDRVELLLKSLQRERTKIIIPTPALAEILVRAGPRAAEQLAKIDSSAAFRIVPFDKRAAVQVALMTRDPSDKPRTAQDTYAKLKYDRQIVAIARVEGATAIYSDDDNVRTYAKRLNLTAISLAQLPLPQEPPIKQDDLIDLLNRHWAADTQTEGGDEPKADEPPGKPVE